MLYVIIYRSPKTGKVYGEIGPEANGYLEFPTEYAAEEHVKTMRERGITVWQIVPLRDM